MARLSAKLSAFDGGRYLIGILLLGLTISPISPAAASDRSDVMDTVSRLTDAFNKGDVAAWTAGSTEEMTIVDELPPHEWHGVGAAANWFSDYAADVKKNGITDTVVTIGQPRHVEITGDRAYVVVPAGYSFRQNHRTVRETGSIWTFAMRKVDGHWRAAAWAWAKN